MSTSTAANDRLSKLPTEMIHRIYQQLKNKDRSNFRLVNHELESKSFDAWVNRHPTVSITVMCGSAYHATPELSVIVGPFHDDNGAHKKAEYDNVLLEDLRSIMLSLPKLSKLELHLYLGNRDGDLDLVRMLQLHLVDRHVDVLGLQDVVIQRHTQLKAMLDVVQPKELKLIMRTLPGGREVSEEVLSRQYRGDFCRLFEGSNLKSLTACASGRWSERPRHKLVRTADGLQHYSVNSCQVYAMGNHAIKACMKVMLEKIENES